MPSKAYSHYQVQRSRADLLTNHAGKMRGAHLKKDKEVFLHAALAAHVACWDSYIKQVVKEKYDAIYAVAPPGYVMLHDISKKRTDASAVKLNTPNAENTRKFLIESSGFDPWGLWVNISFGASKLSALHVRERINEIFKVRHSFAHGFVMPSFTWNQDASGNARLNCNILRSVSQFFDELVTNTDSGYSAFISTNFNIPQPW